MSNDLHVGIRIGYDGKSVASGAAGTRDEIKQIGEAAKRSGAEASQMLDRTAISAAQTAAALRGVPAQFTDIFTSIAAGQNPMQVMLQQGGQLKDMFGGIAPAARALGGYIAGLVNPYTVAAAAVGGLAFAYHQGAKEADAYTRALILSGNAAGATASQLSEAARRIAAATGGTQGAAAEALTLAVGAGVPGAALNAVADAAVRMEQVTGKAIDDTVAEFAKLARDPVAASIKLSEQYNYLTLEVYRQIKALEEQGRHTDAAALAMKAYADVVAERAQHLATALGTLERAWLKVTTGAKNAWDAMRDVGRDDLGLKIAGAAQEVADLENAVKGLGGKSKQARLDAARANLEALRAEKAAQDAVAAATAKANVQQQAGISLAQEEAKYATRQVQMKRELARVEELYAASAKSAADVEARRVAIAGIREKFTEKKAIDNGLDDAAREQAKTYATLYAGAEKLAAGIEQQADAGRKLLPVEKLLADAHRDLSDAQAMEVEKRLAGALLIERRTEAEREAAEVVKIHADAIKTLIAPLEQQALRLEEEVATYGLTAAQIEAVALARLEEARAIAAANDALPGHLAFLDREIEVRKRLVAAADSKDALDANKKATEEMQRDWERMHEQLSQSLTDELMKGGQDAGELLERYFKTLVLRPVIQGVVGATLSAGASALGLTAGGTAGGSGGALNLLSNGSSLYSLASGGGLLGSFGLGAASAASELALGAAFVGPSASLAGGAIGAGASAGLASGSAGAAGALSSISAALPWIGGALAIASIFGGKLFGSKTPAPVEWGLVEEPDRNKSGSNAYWKQYSVQGPFTWITAQGQHLSRNGLSAASLKSSVSEPLAKLDTVLAGYLSETEKTRIGRAIADGYEGEHGWSQGEVDGVMMRRLNRISDAIGGWVDKLADTTTGTLQERYTELAQILSIRGDEEMEQLANDMFNATGKWSYDKFTVLQAGVENFNNLFLNDADQLERYSEAMRKAFEGLNLALPESRDGFKELVEGIDTSTQAGFDLYATLLDLAPTMAAYYNALKSERDIKNELADMENHFSTAVDYWRYQRVAANYDPAFAADYAYNISLGTIRPGAAGNGDLAAEVRALRDDMRARDVALVIPTQYTADTLRRWNSGGMPAVRT